MPPANDRATSSLVLGSFALFVLVVAATFGYTMQSYDAYLDAKPLDATVTGYELQESADEPTLAVTVRVHNPTQRPIVVEGADLTGTIDDRKVARERPGEFPAETIEPGTTETVRVSFWVYEQSESTIEGIRNDELEVGGFLEGRVVDRKIELDVTEGER